MSNVLWVITKTRERLLEELKHLPEYKNYKTSELLEKAVEQLLHYTKLGEPLNVRIPRDTYWDFKINCMFNDVKMQDVIRELIQKYLKELQEKEEKDERNRKIEKVKKEKEIDQ